ncbi:MAG: radical SAM protein, partial [bacterium]
MPNASPLTLAEKFVKAARRSASFRVRDALGIAIKPMKLRLAVTTRCNSRCVMCLVWQEDLIELKKRELSFDEYVKFFEVNRSFLSEINHVSFTGGEPTMREDLVELVRLVSQRFPNASLNINT